MAAISEISEADQTGVIDTRLLVRIQEDRVFDIQFEPDVFGFHEANNFDLCE
jgi:hypothetical protein